MNNEEDAFGCKVTYYMNVCIVGDMVDSNIFMKVDRQAGG